MMETERRVGTGRTGEALSRHRTPRRPPEGRGDLAAISTSNDLVASERALGNLLTVIKAEAQLLERSVHRGGRHQPEQTGERLAAIVTMVDKAAVELHRLSRLRDSASRKQSDR